MPTAHPPVVTRTGAPPKVTVPRRFTPVFSVGAIASNRRDARTVSPLDSPVTSLWMRRMPGSAEGPMGVVSDANASVPCRATNAGSQATVRSTWSNSICKLRAVRSRANSSPSPTRMLWGDRMNPTVGVGANPALTGTVTLVLPTVNVIVPVLLALGSIQRASMPTVNAWLPSKVSGLTRIQLADVATTPCTGADPFIWTMSCPVTPTPAFSTPKSRLTGEGARTTGTVTTGVRVGPINVTGAADVSTTTSNGAELAWMSCTRCGPSVVGTAHGVSRGCESPSIDMAAPSGKGSTMSNPGCTGGSTCRTCVVVAKGTVPDTPATAETPAVKVTVNWYGPGWSRPAPVLPTKYRSSPACWSGSVTGEMPTGVP